MRLLGLVCVLPLLALQDAVPTEKDYTHTPFAELGLEAVVPARDAQTGFVVGGVNDTKLLRALPAINGRAIDKLERAMRPGAQAKAGFLGKDERLVQVLADDNDFVRGQGLTHRELARPLLVATAIARKTDPKAATTFRYRGGRYRVTLTTFRNFIDSPFEDELRTNGVAVVENLATGAKLQYSELVPLMIERYGFYEGRGTPYRVDPRRIVAVFDHLKRAK